MPSRAQRIIRDAQGVVDDLGEHLSSEQRRLLCRALQHQYDQDDESFISDSTEDSVVEGPVLRVRTIVNVQKPPSLWFVIGPLILQAMLSSFALWLR